MDTFTGDEGAHRLLSRLSGAQDDVITHIIVTRVTATISTLVLPLFERGRRHRSDDAGYMEHHRSHETVRALAQSPPIRRCCLRAHHRRLPLKR
jgi:hypothetical protein